VAAVSKFRQSADDLLGGYRPFFFLIEYFSYVYQLDICFGPLYAELQLIEVFIT
jgi:hypothetical protein